MNVNKSAKEFYQLFSGIFEDKLFLQIVERHGTLKYEFESPKLDMTDEKSICRGIMDACYDFFDPKHFTFDEDFVLGTAEPFIIRRYGEKAIFAESKVIPCKSLYDLPANWSWLIMESFLPFEKPLEKPTQLSSRPWEGAHNLRGAWFSDRDTWHGIAE